LSLKLNEKGRLIVRKQSIAERLFGFIRAKITEKWGTLLNEKLHKPEHSFPILKFQDEWNPER
jgi:hypothetical protein